MRFCKNRFNFVALVLFTKLSINLIRLVEFLLVAKLLTIDKGMLQFRSIKIRDGGFCKLYILVF